MGQGPGRVCAGSGDDTGTGQAQKETEQSRAGENRGRFEKTVGRQEGCYGESETRRQKENRYQKGGNQEGGAGSGNGRPGSCGSVKRVIANRTRERDRVA
jgi:hypothetical protein